MSENTINSLDEALEQVAEKYDADIYLYSGPIFRQHADKLKETVDINQSHKRSNAVLILSTYGGDADAAYIIARKLKLYYDNFILFVFGFCKSAGTLIALGADKIVMSDKGEFGPLDVQLMKEDELMLRSSGLDLSKSLSSLSNKAFEIFESSLLDIKKKSGGNITTKTAADIATSMAVGLISPITGQIDPLKVGEVQRSIDIAYQYGVRLGADQATVHNLIMNYPSHSFVIDFQEAADVFENVCFVEEEEFYLEQYLVNTFKENYNSDCVRTPDSTGFIAYLETENKPEENGTSTRKQQDVESKAESSKSKENRTASNSKSSATQNGETAEVSENNGEQSGKDDS